MTRPSPRRAQPQEPPRPVAARDETERLPPLPATVTPFRAAWAVLLWPTRVRNSEWKELLEILPETQRRDFDRLRNRPAMLYGFPRFSYVALPVALLIGHPTSAWTVFTALCLGVGVMFVADKIVMNRLSASAGRLGGSYTSLGGLSGPDWTLLPDGDGSGVP